MLCNACHYGFYEVIKGLILQGVDVNYNDGYRLSFPARFAIYQGRKDIVKLLIDNGLDIHSVRKESKTGYYLYDALVYGRPPSDIEIAILLIEHGSPFDINEKLDNRSGKSIIDVFLEIKDSDLKERFLIALINRGINKDELEQRIMDHYLDSNVSIGV
jgi:ankyrin repeat protein